MLHINAFDDAAKTVFQEVITRREETFQEGASTAIVYDVVKYSKEEHGTRRGTTAEGDTVTLVRRPEAARYNPHDLDGEQLAQLWQGWYRFAIWHGVDEDAAEEAASLGMLHFMDTIPKKGQVERGNHYHAYYSTRAMLRFSYWKGYTDNRRESQRKWSEPQLIWEETQKQQRRNPHPHSLATMQEKAAETQAAIDAATIPAGKRGRATVSQAATLRESDEETLENLRQRYEDRQAEVVENWAEWNGLDLEPQKGLIVDAVDRPQPKTLAAMLDSLTDEDGNPATEREKAEFYQANILHRAAQPRRQCDDYSRAYRVNG